MHFELWNHLCGLRERSDASSDHVVDGDRKVGGANLLCEAEKGMRGRGGGGEGGGGREGGREWDSVKVGGEQYIPKGSGLSLLRRIDSTHVASGEN